MQRDDLVWTRRDVAGPFLENVRGAIPLAHTQLEIMLRLVQAVSPTMTTFLDLGCGDGVLGRAILSQYPDATGVFLDFSEPMLEAARQKLGDQTRCVCIQQDYSTPEWIASVQAHAPFDVIVSGFSIHHQPDEHKYRLYRELYALLRGGGIFLNLEHVASPTQWVESRFDDLMIDSLFAYGQAHDSSDTHADVTARYHTRTDKDANILAPTETQCAWLREIGFQHVDCYFKVFELALFGGMRPA